MSENNYTNSPYAMGDRPADLQHFDPQRDVKIVPHKTGGGETYLFPSDPPNDIKHETNKLPIEMWQDYGNDNAGQVARAARMYERALDSTNRSMVAPEWWQTAGTMVIGGVIGVGVGVVSIGLLDKVNVIPTEYKTKLTEIAMTAGLVAGAEAAKEIMLPKHSHKVSSETDEMVRQARDQARKSYSEAFTQEKIANAANNSVPMTRISSQEKGERLETPQVQMVGAK